MPAGAPKKSAKLKIVDGTYRADRERSQSVVPEGSPVMPAGMTPVAKTFWKHIVKTRGDWLAESDLQALQVASELWAHLRVAQKTFQLDPIGKGNQTRYTTLLAEWGKASARFGLSPSDRERLGPTKGNDGQNAKTKQYLA